MTTAPGPAPVNPLDVVRVLRSAGPAFFALAGLHGELARVEWAAEKNRILKLLVASVVAAVSLLCALLTAGAVALAFSWDTPYRVTVALGLVLVYAAVAGIAWHRIQALAARGREAFAATREEFAADLELIRSRL